MTFKERMPVTVSLVAVVYYAIFLLKTRGAYVDGLLSGEGAIVHTAKSMLLFIVAFIISVIVLFIAQAIFETIRTGDEDAIDDIEDERDRAFEFYSLKIQSLVSGLSFLAMLIVLWLGFAVVLAIHIVFFGQLAGMVIGEMRKHALYFGE